MGTSARGFYLTKDAAGAGSTHHACPLLRLGPALCSLPGCGHWCVGYHSGAPSKWASRADALLLSTPIMLLISRNLFLLSPFSFYLGKDRFKNTCLKKFYSKD